MEGNYATARDQPNQRDRSEGAKRRREAVVGDGEQEAGAHKAGTETILYQYFRCRVKPAPSSQHHGLPGWCTRSEVLARLMGHEACSRMGQRDRKTRANKSRTLPPSTMTLLLIYVRSTILVVDLITKAKTKKNKLTTTRLDTTRHTMLWA
jgi:hypothetical protein